MRWPSAASCTVTCASVLSRSAKRVVKPAGMCWVATTAGLSAGRPAEHFAQRLDAAGRSADGDDPLRRAEAGARRRRGAAARAATFARLRTRALAAIFHLLDDLGLLLGQSLLQIDLRLGDVVDGTEFEACSVASAPACVSDEIISTGIGRNFMIFSRNEMPSMFGISTSSVTTSG